MKAVFAYFRSLFSDLLYWRVCVALFGLPLAGFACFAVFRWHPSEPLEWFGMLLLVLLGLYGAWLVGVSMFGNDATFERSIRYIDDGGELLGVLLILAVALIAIPITVTIRLFKPRASEQ